MKLPVTGLLTVLALTVFGDTRLLTSIQEVYRFGTDQVPGIIGLYFEDDEFSEVNGEPVSVTNPIYIRISVDRNAVLSRTIVDPTGTYTVAQNGAMSDAPIDLMLSSSLPSVYTVADDLPEYAVQIIRGVQGESDVWLRISVPSNRWVDANNDGVGDSAPTPDTPLGVRLALDRGLENNRVSESGFDFSTIANADTYATFGQDTPLSDTRFFVNYNPMGCGVSGGISLSAIDILGLGSHAIPGEPGSPESAPPTVITPPNCNSQGVDVGTMDFLPLNFVGDFVIARLMDQSILESKLFAPDVVKVGQSFELVNQVLGDNISLRVSWNFGVEKLVTTDTKITYAFDEEGQYTVVSTATNGNGATAQSTALITVTSQDAVPDSVQLQSQVLTASEVLLTWQGGSLQDVDLEGYKVYARLGESISFTVLGEVTQTQFIARNLEPGGAYRFLVEPVYSGQFRGNPVFTDLQLPMTQEPMPYHYRIPHLSSSPQGWDSLVVLNPGNHPVSLELRARKADGSVAAVSSALTELASEEKSMGMLYHYFSHTDLEEAAWLELVSSDELQCFQLFGDGESMTGLAVDHQGLYHGVFQSAQGERVELGLVNSSEETATVIFTGWFDGETLPRSVTRTIPGGGKLQIPAQNLFGSFHSDLFRWYTWSASQPLTSFQTWGEDLAVRNSAASMGGGRLFNILPRINPQTHITLTNMSPMVNDAVLEAWSNEGKLISSSPIALQPQSRVSATPVVLTGSNFSGYLVVKSSAPLNCQALYRRIRGDRATMEEAIPGVSQLGERFFFPHVPSPQFWTTDLVVINHSDAEERVIFTAFDRDGHSLKTQTRTVPPHGRFNQTVAFLFGQLPEAAYVRAYALRPVLSAHLLLHTKSGQTPLMGGVAVKPF